MSEDVDERTLFEMYLPPFEGAIKAGLGSVMCSCESPLARSISDVAGVRSCLTEHCRLSGGLQITRSTTDGRARTRRRWAT